MDISRGDFEHSHFHNEWGGVEARVLLHSEGCDIAVPSGRVGEGFMLICHTGHAKVELNHSCQRLASHDIAIAFPGDIFVMSEVSEGFSASWVFYSQPFGDEVLYNFPSSFFKQVYDTPTYRLSNEEYINRMEYIQLLSRKIADKGNICRRDIVANLMRTLFMEIYSSMVTNARISTSEPKRRRRLLDEFMEHIAATPQHREVAYYAEKLCITPKYLSAIVYQGTGCSAKEFINNNTILEIKHLLRSSDHSVKEIADILAFPSDSNLCRFFKACTGTTISEYKQSIKG